MLAVLVHNLSPFAFEFSPGFGIRWYGIAYATGFLLGYALLRELAKRGRIGLTALQVGDLMAYLIAGVVIGGRVGHVVFYEPSMLISFHADLPWWGLLDIHKGGMSSHGGIIGCAVGALIFARRAQLPILVVTDCTAFGAPLGLCLGRLANWVNAELWGKPLPESMQASPPWWAVKYPGEVFEPTFAVERLASLQSLVPPSEPIQDAVYRAAMLHRNDVLTKLEPLLTAYYPSNFIQAFTDGPLLFIVMALVWIRPRMPGMISGVFLIAYGASRMISEQFRAADLGVFAIGSLTLPMLLSVAMIALGIARCVWSSRRAGERLGGVC